jgi:hypothetical protein
MTYFVFNPARDETVDAEYVLIGHPNVTIQIAPYAGGYFVDEWLPDEEAMLHHGVFRSLAAAKHEALKVAGIT